MNEKVVRINEDFQSPREMIEKILEQIDEGKISEVIIIASKDVSIDRETVEVYWSNMLRKDTLWLMTKAFGLIKEELFG